MDDAVTRGVKNHLVFSSLYGVPTPTLSLYSPRMNAARIELPAPRHWTFNPRGRNSIPSPQAEIQANSFRFCTYKITSHLHILKALKTTCFHGFTGFSGLTPAFSAHTRLPGGYGTLR